MSISCKDNYKLALAALLHDVGKFAQRAEIKINPNDINEYCPEFNFHHTHLHSAHTADFLNKYIVGDQDGHTNIIPHDFLESFIDIAAKHHKKDAQDSTKEWIVAVSDRLASGFEREVFEEYNSKLEQELNKNYKDQRLDHIFNENSKFPLKPLSPNTIFPESNQSNKDSYSDLWHNFTNDINKILDLDCEENIKVQALNYLLKHYTSFIPSSSTFKIKDYSPVKPNISLYEHLKTSAVFASTIASMDEQQQQKVINNYRLANETTDNKDFLLIAGDFFGIQNFIFEEMKTAYASKILRAKSAYIQILTKVLAHSIATQIGLSEFSIISDKAGKFEILGINKEDVVDKLKTIQKDLNKYFSDRFFGLTGVGIAWTKASISDFLSNSKKSQNSSENPYKKLRIALYDQVEEIKYKKFDLISIQHKVFSYDENIKNENLCEFCNKRKGDKVEDHIICSSCLNYKKLGEKLVTYKYMGIIHFQDPPPEHSIEIFTDYYVVFYENKNDIRSLHPNLVWLFDISKTTNFEGFAKWEISSYVAKQRYKIIAFDEIIKKPLKPNQTNEGLQALMTLKGDVDGMGNFIKHSDVTDSFAKYNFFSGILDYFFSKYVPYLMAKKYPDTYTVFTGGDDLFLIGAWDEIMQLATEIRKQFIKFTSDTMTISMGMILSKAHKPVNFLAETSEEVLEQSKEFKLQQTDDEPTKNALTAFNETVYWDYFINTDFEQRLIEIEKISKIQFSTAFLYRLLSIVEMSRQYQNTKDIKLLMWVSKLNYTFVRTILEKVKDKKLQSQLNSILTDLTYNIKNHPKECKIYLHKMIYERRSN